ncbi:hypothetical protein Daus18300_010159 [Diaporthe australafricana]|uniref:Uncharacterized protein n=1 Tax=Diaporthe australafricana TaxID=127596 RepID=A0ABR3WBC6_9PEZI
MEGEPASRRSSRAGSERSIDSQDASVSFKRVGLSKEFAITKDDVRTHNSDGTKTAWKEVETPPDDITSAASPSKQLYLVRHNQAEGEPLHWSLETADVEGGDLDGNVYQVSGDAEFMDYRPYQDVPTLSCLDIRDYFVLVPNLTPQMEDIVRHVAVAEPPPQAKSRKDVTENCQHWSIRVMRKLVERGMMDSQKVIDCHKLVEPVRK